MGRFATGVTIVTTRDEQGADCGMTVSAFSSVSLKPALVQVSIGHDASMYGAMSRCDYFGVSILAAAQEALSRHFADQEIDRFEGIGFHRGKTRVALLDDALAWLECAVMNRVEAGDHTIIIGEVHAAVTRPDRPLLYYRGGYAQLER